MQYSVIFRLLFLLRFGTLRNTCHMKRDNTWLQQTLDAIWQRHFADIERKNTVMIKFGRFAKYQFGIITYDKCTNVSKITINKMFQGEDVPESVVVHTIGHELTHYSHGFSSPHKRLHKYPHHGGVVDKDMRRRGLGIELAAYKRWLRDYRKHLRES